MVNLLFVYLGVNSRKENTWKNWINIGWLTGCPYDFPYTSLFFLIRTIDTGKSNPNITRLLFFSRYSLNAPIYNVKWRNGVNKSIIGEKSTVNNSPIKPRSTENGKENEGVVKWQPDSFAKKIKKSKYSSVIQSTASISILEY